MEKIIRKVSSPESLDIEWDKLAGSCYLKRQFLLHLHKYNYCSQLYYELYHDSSLVAGTIVYTVKTNILTFLNIPSPVRFRIIGIPVSIANPPFIGDPAEIEYLLSEILKTEKGIILGLNFTEDYLRNKVLNLRTLPTILLNLESEDVESYEKSLRHPYRRSLHRNREKFRGVTSETTLCSEFNDEHYQLYLRIMKHSTTKLEILHADVFRYLPSEFELTTYSASGKMLFWHILCRDEQILYYFMCGMNYSERENFNIYNNSLLGIISIAMKYHYRTIDLGQTAEIAKTRVGGIPDERRMFLYHHNPVIFGMFKLFRRLITYSKKNKQANVFKTGVPLPEKILADKV